MAVNVTCPACGNATAVGDELLGRKLRCKSCSEVFVATAAKAKVAAGRAGADDDVAASPSRNGSTNGVHKEVPVARGRAVAQPKKSGGGSGMLWGIVAGAGGLAVMGAIMVWALFLRGDGSDSNTSQASVTPVAPKININNNDSPAVPSNVEKAPETKTNEEPAPKTKASPVAAMTKRLMTGFSESPKTIPLQMPADVVERIKKSAVMFRVSASEGTGEGSGWFAEPGILVTNSHVVFMLDRAAPPPHRIEIYLNRGLPNERIITGGKILAVDRDNDLAIVQVKDKNLPAPLPICPSSELYEGQRLYVMGFPLGTSLAEGASQFGGSQVLPTVKLRQTSVAGRLAHKTGGVKLIQTEGGADHGNSGGAVLDAAGNVRAILTLGIDGTTLRWVVPSEYAVHLLQGRVLSILPGQAVREGGSVRQPFTAMVADPMKRIKKITLDVWAGDAGNSVRPATDKRPSPLSGDSAVVSTELPYNQDMQVRLGDAIPCAGNCVLPEKRDGQVYWIQPCYERTDGTTRWGEAAVLNYSGLPVEKKGATLAIKHTSGNQQVVQIESKFGTGLAPEGYSVPIRRQHVKVDLNEKTRGMEPEGAARVQYEYTDFHLGDQEIDEYFREAYKDLFSAARGMKIEAIVTKRGLIKSPKANFTAVSPRFRGIMSNFNFQVMQSLEGHSLLLPDKDVAPEETWDDEYNYTFQVVQNKTENSTFKMRYKYHGSRMREGREEGVVTYQGIVVKSDGGASTSGENSNRGGGNIDRIIEQDERRNGLFGFTQGAALVDLQTGMTTLSKARSDAAFDIVLKLRNEAGQEREVTVTFGAILETALRRAFGTTIPNLQAEALLPNQEEPLNPFVGAPDPNVAQATGGISSADAAVAAATGTAALEMKKEVLDKVKASAALIRVQRDDGGGDGSGWLVEPGIVITNAHVVGMWQRGTRPPTAIDVYFNYGLANVKKHSAKLLTVDHDSDLAVLQVPTSEGDPEPFSIVPSTDLVEGQRLFVVGFPGGSFLNKSFGIDGIDKFVVQLKIRDTTVAGRFDNQRTKLLKYIQLEGGVTGGNSGGAIVDMNGAVRCVAVAAIPGTQLAMAIPSEYAHRLMQGYPLEVHPKYAYKDGSVARQPVEIKFGDPMKRVKKVQLDYWVGKPGLPRRSAKVLPERRPDDSPRKTADMTYDAETAKAKGDFVLPEAEPGFAYWVQPRYIDGSGKECWGEAIFFAPDGPAVERRDIALNANFKVGSKRLIDVTTHADFRYVYLGADYGEVNHLFVTLAEVIGPYDVRNKGQQVQYQFADLRFGLPRTQSEVIKIILTLIQAPDFPIRIREVMSQAWFNKDGTMKPNVITDVTRVQPFTLQPLFKQFSDAVLQCVQTMSIKFPNATVKYGETWKQPTNLLIAAKNKYEPALFDLNMTYLGVRERAGRMEAVVEIKGSIAQDRNAKTIDVRDLKTEEDKEKEGEQPKGGEKGKGKGKGKGEQPKDQPKDEVQPQPSMQLPPATVGKKKPLYGDVKGYAYIDVDSGHVSFCKMTLDIDVEIMHKDKQSGAEIPVRAGGTVVMDMIRRSSAR